ncbi:hypothetical protein ACL02T_29875 [Pseudonocardia sp. RS010]|uniref:hypothetical protein n=1 Tax=Pseudonocardia sp. RS010 TaxID=3385979 RepID=UPI0039A228FB
MRSRSDDELYSFQNVYLGPPGRTLPFKARYIAYALWVGWVFILLILRAQLGLMPGFDGYLMVVILAVVATKLTMRVITPERPVLGVLRMFLAELNTPRANAAAPVVTVSDPRHVLVSVTRPRPEPR